MKKPSEVRTDDVPNTLYPLLIYAILKVYSSKETPLTSNEINTYMEQWIHGNFDAKLLNDERNT